jgi:hypothetical protein
MKQCETPVTPSAYDGVGFIYSGNKPSFFQTLVIACTKPSDTKPSTRSGDPMPPDKALEIGIKVQLDIWKIVAFVGSGLALLLLIVIGIKASRR